MIFDSLAVAILYFAALAWGSNELWAMAILVAAPLLALAGRLIWNSMHGQVRLSCSWFLVPVMLFLGYVGYQVLKVRSALEVTDRALPHTVAAHSTIVYLLLAIAYFALMMLVSIGFHSRDQVKRLILFILVLGVFEAVYGLVPYLGGCHFIWNYPVNSDIARGTFVNRNHYALFLNLTICCGMGYLYYRSVRLLGGLDLTVRHVLRAPGHAQLAWIILWLALTGLALIMSMSRMGIVALFGCVGMMVVSAKFLKKSKRPAVLGLALLFAIVSQALYTGIDAVLVRYEKISENGNLEKDRIPIWRDAWRMIQKYPLFGQGLGSFRWTFPAFEKLEFDMPARYAHNDSVQTLAEVGAVGIVLLLWAFVACWRTAARNLLQSEDPLVRGIGLATLGVLTATALQEITDFSLYIPGVAAIFAILIGVNLRASMMCPEGY